MTDTSKIDHRSEEIILSLIEEGVFRVDSNGKIWRTCDWCEGKMKKLPHKEWRRAEYLSTNGYLRIRVSLRGIRIRVSAHRVVWRYFNGDIPRGCIIDHIDENRMNNRPTNLEPVTQSENAKRSIERKRRKKVI